MLTVNLVACKHSPIGTLQLEALQKDGALNKCSSPAAAISSYFAKWSFFNISSTWHQNSISNSCVGNVETPEHSWQQWQFILHALQRYSSPYTTFDKQLDALLQRNETVYNCMIAHNGDKRSIGFANFESSYDGNGHRHSIRSYADVVQNRLNLFQFRRSGQERHGLVAQK